MNVITRPKLPPKAGYVEVVGANGEHVYKPAKETEAEFEKKVEVETLKAAVDTVKMDNDTLLGVTSDGSIAALEFRKAVQLFACSLTDEASMMGIASIYPEYQIGVAYKAKSGDRPADIFRYGVNGVGDPQLYMVLQNHTSAAEWTPDTATSLYKKIGIGDDGVPEWVQPLGATDAYDFGDIVMHNGEKWRSTYEGANVWEPGVYGWEKVVDTNEGG